MNYGSRSLVGVAYLSVAVCLSGCDLRPYEMREASAGNVYVLNRMTGTLQTTKDGRLTAVPPAAEASSRVITCTSHYPAYGIQFALALKVLGQAVYYRLDLRPEVETSRTVVQEKWNAHIDRLQATQGFRIPTANLNLGTADGFYVFEHRVNLSDTAEMLAEGDRSGNQRQAQGHVELSREVLDVLSACTVGFSGFPPAGDELSEPAPKLTLDKPE